MNPLITLFNRPALRGAAVRFACACLVGGSTLLAGAAQAQGSAPVVYRLSAGGSALNSSLGQFAADQYFSSASSVYINTAPIAGTTDDALYQKERFSTTGQLSYALPVTNGTYSVVLHFAEIFWTRAGQRVFNIGLEGNTVRTNFDIIAKVGPLTATTETFVATVTDGVLNLDLTVPYLSGGADQAKLSALEVFSGNILSNGTPKTSNATALRVFPNPAVDHFTVACTVATAQPATLTLFDQLGRAVQNQVVRLQLGDNQVPVQTGQLPNGLYQLTLRTADGLTQRQKVLVQI